MSPVFRFFRAQRRNRSGTFAEADTCCLISGIAEIQICFFLIVFSSFCRLLIPFLVPSKLKMIVSDH